jgi:hypothetical protein
MPALRDCALTPATLEAYIKWMAEKQGRLGKSDVGKEMLCW